MSELLPISKPAFEAYLGSIYGIDLEVTEVDMLTSECLGPQENQRIWLLGIHLEAPYTVIPTAIVLQSFQKRMGK